MKKLNLIAAALAGAVICAPALAFDRDVYNLQLEYLQGVSDSVAWALDSVVQAKVKHCGYVISENSLKETGESAIYATVVALETMGLDRKLIENGLNQAANCDNQDDWQARISDKIQAMQ
jgi:hypothetical protein